MKLKQNQMVKFKPWDRSWRDIYINEYIYNKCFKGKSLTIQYFTVDHDQNCPVFKAGQLTYYTLQSHCIPLEVKTNKPIWF